MERDASSTIGVRLTSTGLGDHAFSPLNVPGGFDVSLTELDPDLIRRLGVELDVSLQAGHYPIPLTRSLVLPVDVPTGGRVVGRVEARRRKGPDGEETVVEELDLEFQPPLVIQEIVPVLAQLQDLVQDDQVATLLTQVRELTEPAPTSRRGRLISGIRRLGSFDPTSRRGRLVRRARDWFRGVPITQDGLREGAGQLANVTLRRISARPVMRHGVLQLDLRFSGLFNVFGAAPVPFFGAHLPHVILPWPYASLQRLLSDQPLASATLHSSRVPVVDMVRVVSEALEDARGHVELSLDGPNTSVVATLPSRREVTLDLPAAGEISLSGDFSGVWSREQMVLEVNRLAVAMKDASFAVKTRLTVEGPAGCSSLMGRCAEALVDGDWGADDIVMKVMVDFVEETQVGALDVSVRSEHPLIHGEADMSLSLEDVRWKGVVGMEYRPSTRIGRATALDLRFSSRVACAPDSRMADPSGEVVFQCLDTSLSGSVVTRGPRQFYVTLDGQSRFDLVGSLAVREFPELQLHAGQATGGAVGRADFHVSVASSVSEDDLVLLDFEHTRATMTLDQVRGDVQGRWFALPSGSVFEMLVADGQLTTAGLGRAAIDLRWDLLGQSPVLAGRGREVEIFVPALRAGAITLGVSPAGGLRVYGEPSGLYDAHYFNALLNPDQELDRLRALLEDDEGIDRVLAASEVFSDDLAELLGRGRRLVERGRAALDAEGIEGLGDVLPAATMARLISRVLGRDTELAARVEQLWSEMVQARGLDERAARALYDESFPGHEDGYALERGLRIIGRAVAPTEPLPRRETHYLGAVSESEAYTEMLASIPTALAMYETVSSPEPLPEGFSGTVARLAPYLQARQLQWMVGQGRSDWRPGDLVRLRRIAALKERVALMADTVGGPAFAPQTAAIGMFLGATVHHRSTSGDPVAPLPGEPEGLLASPDLLLGPEDVAKLLRVGSAAPLQGAAVQLNQRLLLDQVLQQPPNFLRHVLYEMSAGIPRVLVGVLMSLLNMEQSKLRAPLDLVDEFSSRLGVTLPRQSDFMAGGRHASRSYYEALDVAAVEILADREAYAALCGRLHQARQAKPVGLSVDTSEDVLAAQAAIAQADALGARCTFRGSEPARRRRATEAYEAAFEACARVRARDPRAFRQPWLKAFWQRNYEALMVRSVVRNVLDDVDRVRYWLKTRLGKSIPRSEQRLIDAVIDVLYAAESDREALKRDPLVRLLIDPPEGHYDFTLVSCMGVITEGEQGEELQDAYERLAATRGVQVIRANTASVRSLDFNAGRIEEAIRRVQGPWGYIGYSQGCANGLRAETLLMGGTPEQQALMETMVCRHMLFGAHNGSGHSTAADIKVRRAMVDTEHFLAHYQAQYSRPVIDAALRAMRAGLDSPIVANTIAGGDSLSYDGVVQSLREIQIKDDVPTTTMRGIVQESIRPEALDMLSNVLTQQMQDDAHDTQVMAEEAVGYPLRVRHPQADAMRSCDIGSRVQVSHHWSPLLKATEFVTTARDRERAIYDFPKDRHVFPWVEVNARFGVIERLPA